jgi:class 3 adenylate cyclase/tetratricopeptide (TPR) repeat protein
VQVCASCGHETAEHANFCPKCGAPYEIAPAREQRKTVTVVFCDVAGSTALGDSTDPEALRALLVRYFERMRGIVEAHGGTVEKFIGDAVMAVFGVPVAHEDDALRACRAAVEMRDALPELGILGRIGVNTGEVVTGTEERLATGDAVNVAARLEQAAQPGEALVGKATLALVQAVVEVGEERLLELKGKTELVSASPLLGVTGELERRFATRMVGRENELLRLRASFDQAVHDRSCQLFTLLGSAGVGKSRVVAEFLGGFNVRVVRGRCLSYGEGVTYWPVVEILRQLDTLPEGDAAQPLRSLLGEADTPALAEEIAWGFRKLLEQEAQREPIVVVFDDLHWGEETLLDLVEHIADLARDASILLLCMGRPELLERRPSWGGGKWNATTILLEPLDAAETEALLGELGEVRTELRERIVEVAEGNPLFLEEMLALVRDSGGVKVEVPPTIHALLAARLDQLDASERSVLERGSVEGRVFHRGAIEALAPEESQLTARLTSLVRKELVRPDKPQVRGEDAYRFRHLLIRDAAYEALPKAARATLHERFADWLEEHGRDLVELDEILGYHLEQAHHYRVELGTADEVGHTLVRRAAERLLAAGRRAAGARGDMLAAATLFERASALLPVNDPRWLEVQPELAEALIDTGPLARAGVVLGEAIEVARRVGDEEVEARALLAQASLTSQTDPAHDMARLRVETERLIGVFERLGDDRSLAHAWRQLGKFRMWLGASEAGAEALSRALVFAERAGDHRERRETLVWLLLAYTFGPFPAEEGLLRADEIRLDPDGGLQVEAMALVVVAALKAMQGRFDEARREMAAGRSMLRDLGFTVDWAGSAMISGRAELLAGDVRVAERELREGYDALDQLGETGYLSTIAALLAEAVLAQGRLDEAMQLSEASERASAPDDLESQAQWRAVRAHALAQQGVLDEAERLARESIAVVDPTDFLVERANAYRMLAEVLRIAGRPSEAAAALEAALPLYARKGDLVSAARTRTMRDELGARGSA